MLWETCSIRLKEVIPASAYTMWIRPLQVHVDEVENKVQIYTPNQHWYNAVKKNYLEIIAIAVEQASEGRILAENVELLVDSRPGDQILTPEEKNNQQVSVINPIQTTTTIIKPVKPVAVEHSATSFKAKKEEKIHQISKIAKHRELNQLFTFSLFVEGPSNRMAAETCRKVLTHLGETQNNPLFLYGATGLGKTHLMQAVGNALLQARPTARVLYMTTEDFVRAYVTAVKLDKMEEFKKEYRSLDLLLVDDIHLLSGEKSMTEFFHTFNALLEDSKQIILTSDRYPKELTGLDASLVSRLSWGLSVQIEPPDLETRVEILLKKAESANMDLPRNCALFIAQHVVANVRELEGALHKVNAFARFRGGSIDMDLVRESLKEILSIRAKKISVENIQKVVSEYFRISVKDLVGPKRTRIYARPRQIAMGLSRELTGDSYPEIGMAFGGRDHSTVMHACEKVQELCAEDISFDEDYKNLLKLLQC